MFFLKKIFQLRDHANPSAEKAFLEHLEDLRVCITRIVLTLLLATVVCFIFRNELMSIIRRPVEQVWERGQTDSLQKTGISLKNWEKAKSIAEAAIPLSAAERTVFLEHAAGTGEDAAELLETIRAVYYFRAAATLEEGEPRENFAKALPGIDNALRAKILALIEGNPSAKVDARGKLVLMQALKPTEGFMLSIKLAFFAGIVISFPFLLFFLLQFVLPGMHDAERKALWPAMAIGFGLFLAGVFFAYFIVLPRVLEFFHEYSSGMMIENEWRIGYYISFATQFTLIFGLSFELPVLVMTLVKLGILNSEMMRRTRAYAILTIFVIAAIITPTPDAFTLCLLAGPMVVLYEICIWLALILEKKAARREEEEEKERMARLLARRERRAALGEDEEEDGDHDPDHDPDHPDGGDDSPPDPSGHGDDPGFPDHEHGHDPDHPHDPYHEHDPYHDYHHEHDHEHDHDPHHDPAHDPYAQDPHEQGEGHEGEHDHDPDDYRGQDASEDSEAGEPPSTEDDHDGDEQQQDFDFHEEFDPALKETGEQEDVSDPWPEEDEYVDPSNPPEDVPEEEKNRDPGDPDKKDQD